jgi:hypothetical protein
MGRSRIWLVYVAALACGESHFKNKDGGVITDGSGSASDAGACWPIGKTTPNGTQQLGIGTGDFIPMPDEVNLEYGTQGGFDVPTRGLITGLNPGDPTNVLDPSNPKSEYHAYLMNGQLAYDNGPCPTTLGYIPNPAGEGYLSPSTFQARFFECMGPAQLFYKQFMVQGQVIDSTGGYAMAEKVVTVLPPVGWPDAGVPDAPVDAPSDAQPPCPPQ